MPNIIFPSEVEETSLNNNKNSHFIILFRAFAFAASYTWPLMPDWVFVLNPSSKPSLVIHLDKRHVRKHWVSRVSWSPWMISRFSAEEDPYSFDLSRACPNQSVSTEIAIKKRNNPNLWDLGVLYSQNIAKPPIYYNSKKLNQYESIKSFNKQSFGRRSQMIPAACFAHPPSTPLASLCSSRPFEHLRELGSWGYPAGVEKMSIPKKGHDLLHISIEETTWLTKVWSLLIFGVPVQPWKSISGNTRTWGCIHQMDSYGTCKCRIHW